MGNKLQFQKLIILLSFFLVMVGCDDVVEKDIEDKEVVLNTPGDSVSLKRFDVTFWWEPIEGVSEFQVQVVSPSFSKSEYLWVDSIVASNKLVFTLETGEYEWRVKGRNGAYETSFSATRSFSIDSAIDISLQKVLLTAPSDNLRQNKETVLFKWQDLPLAEDYFLEIRNEGFTLDTVVATNSISLEVEETSTDYTWNVTAKSGDIESKISESWSFWIDLTAPEIPLQLTPKNDSIFIGFPITLNWESNDEDKMEDQLYLYTDAEGTNLVEGFPVVVTSMSFTFEEDDPSPLEEGIYYWSIKAIDKAGNESASPVLRKFTLNAI